MSYQPIRWVNGVTSLSAQNLNHMEQGIKDNEDLVNKAVLDLSMIPQRTNVISNVFTMENRSYTPNSYGYIVLHVHMTNPNIRTHMELRDRDTNYWLFEYDLYTHTFSCFIPVIKGTTYKVQFTIGESNVNYISGEFYPSKKVV